MITNKNYNVDLASLSDKKLMYNFAKEINFDLQAEGRKSTRDSDLIKLIKLPGLMVSASGASKTIFLSFGCNELCNRLTLLLQERKAGNNSNIISQQFIAIVVELLKYKCMSQKEHEQILVKYNLLHE